MDLKKVSEISAVAIPFLMLCSSIQLLTFYSHWSIPIFDYLSSAEIVFLFIKPLLTILLFASLYVGFNLLFVGATTLYVVKAKKTEPAEELRQPEPNKPVTRTQRLIQFLALGAVAVFVPFVFFQGIWYDFDLIPVVILHIVIWAGVALGLWYLRGKKGERLPFDWVLAAAIPVLLSASFFYGRYQAHYTTTYPVSQTIVMTDGAAIATDDNTLFLGKTSGYYFFYKVTERESVILPAAQIKSVSIKQPD